MIEKKRRLVAYREAGHAVIARWYYDPFHQNDR
jgi:ATP-dependent Zn protease